MLSNFAAVFIGGGLGSVLRFGVSLLLLQAGKTILPLATLLSNMLSCLVFGLVLVIVGEKTSTDVAVRMLLLTGFCGGFSTFSAFSYETVELIRSGNILYALINILVSMAVCMGIIYFFTRSNG